MRSVKILSTLITSTLILTAVFISSCADPHFLDKTKIDGSILQGKTVESNDPIAQRTVLIAQNFNFNNHRPQFFGLCSGVILNSNTILTAAHCVKNFKSSKVLFTTDIYSKPIDEKNIFNIENAIVHELYSEQKIYTSLDEQTLKYDVALLKLDRPILNANLNADADSHYLMLKSTAQFIKNTDSIALLNPVVAGFGKTHLNSLTQTQSAQKDQQTETYQNTPVNGILEKAHVEISEAQYSMPTILIDQHLKPGVCSGDSGGPLFVNRDGRLYLQGLAIAVLFNNPFEQKYSLCYGQGLYLNLDFLKDWISNQLNL